LKTRLRAAGAIVVASPTSPHELELTATAQPLSGKASLRVHIWLAGEKQELADVERTGFRKSNTYSLSDDNTEGANQADATNRLFNERYDNVFSDPTSIGWWHVTYIAGCDPANEGPL
jgi:hypothetical protein